MASLSFPHVRGSNSFSPIKTLPTSLTTQRLRTRVGFLRVVADADANAKHPLGEPDLSVTVNGLHLPNPFVIGSGPPGTNYTVMKRAFDEGWGAVIAKTVSLDAAKVINVTPRYARLRAGANGSAKGQIIGWENIELISDRPLETMLKEFKQLKEEYPDRILIASIMEEYDKAAWEELIDRVEQTGIDAIEINFSCPHGMPERKMGAAVGQDCALLEELGHFISMFHHAVCTVLTVHPKFKQANMLHDQCILVIDASIKMQCEWLILNSWGLFFQAVHPIALGKVMAIAKMMKSEFNDEQYSLSVLEVLKQVCTGVMMHGYGLVKKLCDELKDFMKMHNFLSIGEFRGASLEYFTTHMDLVRRQQEAIQLRKAVKKGLQSDKDWTGDGFVNESESMVSN
ncbi:hypothetical protein GH714_024718 [Hevea brasiliensis]|uniref:dihydropyrimidine dehydrogenase (NADP(+)) n=1 Tax=Hevea brasiliensis TaxID=3981 RepID=A0A6A6MYA6_HEVBR|nr:hypothetical protein GH714_024718 [Hevea brasiliensis]